MDVHTITDSLLEFHNELAIIKAACDREPTTVP